MGSVSKCEHISGKRAPTLFYHQFEPNSALCITTAVIFSFHY